MLIPELEIPDHSEIGLAGEIAELKKVNQSQATTIVNLKKALKDSESDLDNVIRTIKIVERRNERP